MHHLALGSRDSMPVRMKIEVLQRSCSVLWTQDLFQEDLKVTLVLLGELVLAPAEVHEHPQSKGNIHTVGKEGDFFRHRVLEDFDFIFGQTLEESATRIPGRECHVHQPDINSDRFLS